MEGALRQLLASFLGQRVLMTDAAPSETAGPRPSPHHAQARPDSMQRLVLLPVAVGEGASAADGAALAERLQAGLRAAASLPAGQVPVLFPAGKPEAGAEKAVAAVLLGTRSASLMEGGEEAGLPGGPDRADFYRQMIRLHHGNAAVRDGETLLLDHAAQGIVGWVQRPRAITPLSPAIVILCNMTDRPVPLSLKAEIAGMHLRGSFLRTVIRTDAGMGTMNLNAMTLPPESVYIGELRY